MDRRETGEAAFWRVSLDATLVERARGKQDKRSPAGRRMPQHPIRIAYVAEFLLAFLVVLYGWAEIGGQSHMDFIPWYWKLIAAGGLCFAVVQATAAAVDEERAWNPRTARWLFVILVSLLVMGSITYHYHSQEPVDEQADMVDESACVQANRGSVS